MQFNKYSAKCKPLQMTGNKKCKLRNIVYFTNATPFHRKNDEMTYLNTINNLDIHVQNYVGACT